MWMGLVENLVRPVSIETDGDETAMAQVDHVAREDVDILSG